MLDPREEVKCYLYICLEKKMKIIQPQTVGLCYFFYLSSSYLLHKVLNEKMPTNIIQIEMALNAGLSSIPTI